MNRVGSCRWTVGSDLFPLLDAQLKPVLADGRIILDKVGWLDRESCVPVDGRLIRTTFYRWTRRMGYFWPLDDSFKQDRKTSPILLLRFCVTVDGRFIRTTFYRWTIRMDHLWPLDDSFNQNRETIMILLPRF